MAVSIVNYTGDGSTSQYIITFDYIDRTHVSATVDGSASAFTFINDTTIQFTTAPASAAAVKIVRQTPVAALVDFTDGSTLFEADLDLAHRQNRLLAVESRDRADNAITTLNNNINNIDTVAASDAAINTVATNVASVNNVSTNMAEVLLADTNAGIATTKAGEASVDASTSSQQAAIATTKAGEAASSAAAALVSKNAAAASETDADADRVAAQAAATTATTKASEASTSETNAVTSASTATTKASEAATSATNAATSATESETAKDAAETARDAALAALDNFDDRYLGAKANAPTVDNDGNALIVGALYFNTGTDKLYIWNGTAWQVTTSGAAAGDLISTNNLSDVTSAPASRTNLGLGTTDSPTFGGLTVNGTISTTNGTDINMDASASGQLRLDGNGYGGAIALNAQGMNIYTNSASRDVIFGTNETERMRIDGSGIDVTGTVTATALTVEGLPSGPGLIKIIDSDGPNESRLTQSGSHLYVDNYSTGSLRFRTDSGKERMSISGGGDISFFPVAGGGTAGFFWDSSTERLGIGTTSPTSPLDVVSSGTAAETIAEFGNASVNDGLSIETNGNLEWGFNTKNSRSMTFSTNQTERMRINGSGNVGIGTNNPATALDVLGGIRSTSSGGYNQITTTSIGDATFDSNGNTWLTVKNGVPASVMRIASSGNVGIGTSSPATALEVNGTVTATTVDLGDWTITESSGVLHFATGGTNKMKLDASGNLTVVGNVTAYGTI